MTTLITAAEETRIGWTLAGHCPFLNYVFQIKVRFHLVKPFIANRLPAFGFFETLQIVKMALF